MSHPCSSMSSEKFRVNMTLISLDDIQYGIDQYPQLFVFTDECQVIEGHTV